MEALDKGAGHLVRVLRDEGPPAVEGLAVLGDEVDVSQESVATLLCVAVLREFQDERTSGGKRGNLSYDEAHGPRSIPSQSVRERDC